MNLSTTATASVDTYPELADWDGEVPSTPADNEIVWSKYQTDFFRILETTLDSILLEAVAGSGKSTTIKEGVRRLPSHLSVLFLAFNKSIASELDQELPSNAKAKTFHGVGFSAWGRVHGFNNLTVDDSKVKKIVKSMLDAEHMMLYGGLAIKLVAYAKNHGVGTHLCRMTERAFRQLIDHYGIVIDMTNAGYGSRDWSPEEVEQAAIDTAMAALTASNEMPLTVDYNDMLYLPLLHGVQFWQNDVVFVDEAQDTNSVQIELLKRMVKRNGRVIAVGDRAQAIYGFRGSMSNAMTKLKDAFSMREMPLTVSYRCAKAVVQEARTIVDHIEPAESAEDGLVDEWEPEPDGPQLPTFDPDDAILCRTTAPLFKMAYKIIADGQGCRILGREIGDGLVDMIEKMQARTIEGLVDKLNDFERRETEKFMAKDQESRAAALQDKCDCIRFSVDALAENERTIGKLVRRIRSMFESNGGKVTTLCTVHKAKGLEWKRVYVLKPELMPHPMAKQAWEMDQERNLQYVAITRAKRELIYIPGFVIDELKD